MTVDAKSERFDEKGAMALLEDANTIVVAKGKKSLTFAPKAKDFDRDALLAGVIGPSGNLRAPTVRLGKTWIVGYHEDVWRERLGG